jgi:heat shock protein HslJ
MHDHVESTIRVQHESAVSTNKKEGIDQMATDGMSFSGQSMCPRWSGAGAWSWEHGFAPEVLLQEQDR